MSDWRRNRLAAGLIIGAFVIVQLAVPISRLGAGDPARFGWQMYSSARPSPQFVVETADGDIAVDLDDYLAARRVEIDVSDALPEHLCSVVDGAIRVTWEDGAHEC